MFLLDHPDDPSRLPRFELSPEGLLGELHNAQATLTAAEHYVSLWRTKNKPFSAPLLLRDAESVARCTTHY
jgi:hypothetical protein